ncbi:Small GTP-binding protein domain protein [Candidatus Sulfobium mesophilum]|uniref:Ferrous iron transport protein B n=1 Tax=Candidatus Sulfobium mesophilum TaxID=2016548 RepID=A0A2U3QGY7_9BACT|nr:Small GTP-binding protein domain protein [Candidatus Sulfobium mesophilum]
MQNVKVSKEEKKKHKYSKIVLVGNPNVGKSVIFGLLTGKYVTVSNYPGTTVEVSNGNLSLDGKRLLIIDSPGVNSFVPMSEDERVTRDILLADRPENIVLVADSKNLKRALMLLLQLADMDLPCILTLNMEDEAAARGIEIDYKKLEQILGVKVIGTVAPQRKGIQKLKEALLFPTKPKISMHYGEKIEYYLSRISALLPDASISKRSLALMVLSGDDSMRGWFVANLEADKIKEIEDIRDEAQAKHKEQLATLISKERIGMSEKIVRDVMKKSQAQSGFAARWLGKWSMHPLWGFLFLLFALFCFYEFVGKFGAGTLVNFFEQVIFGKYLSPGIEKVVRSVIPFTLLQDFLVGQYGMFTMAITYAVAIILPITATFFIAFGFLEDSGYLPRIAVLANSALSKIGLNGKAVLPMVLGLGCGTMATMTTRILETKRERIIATFLIALAIPCSAQLGVIMGMLGPYPLKVTVWWLGAVISVLMLTGYIASRVIPGEKADFFLEIPPIRLPRMGNILMKTVGRIEWYLKEAVPLFILGTFVLFVLDKSNILRWLENAASPVVVNFLGLPEKTASVLILGFLRRDYGAAGLFQLSKQGLLSTNQVIVSIITLTLFVPCLASFFMIIKERGTKSALLMFSLITTFALLIGGGVNLILKLVG